MVWCYVRGSAMQCAIRLPFVAFSFTRKKTPTNRINASDFQDILYTVKSQAAVKWLWRKKESERNSVTATNICKTYVLLWRIFVWFYFMISISKESNYDKIKMIFWHNFHAFYVIKHRFGFSFITKHNHILIKSRSITISYEYRRQINCLSHMLQKQQ